MTNPIQQPEVLLPEDQIKIATARTIREWMEIYTEIIGRVISGGQTTEELKGLVLERYRAAVSRLRRIVRDFEVAGLDIHEDLEFEGIPPILMPDGKVYWDESNTEQRLTFIWPDGQRLSFQGDDAVSATGFFKFWQSSMTPVVGPREGPRRLISPGSAEEKRYFDAKAKAMRDREQPDD